MAQSVIKAINAKEFENKQTGKKTTSITITMEDGVSGYLDDKASDKMLQQGESVSYSLSVKQNKKGENYNLLSVNRTAQAGAPQQYQPQPAPQPTPQAPKPSQPISAPTQNVVAFKVEASMRAMSEVMEAYRSERIDFPKVPETYKEVCHLLYDEIDSIFKGQR